MFGIFNLTRVDEPKSVRVKVKEKENSDQPCYGGFSSRWRYEECCRKHRLHGPTPANAALCVLVCFCFGLAGIAGGIIIYDFMQRNRSLHYPTHSQQNSDEIIVTVSDPPSVENSYDFTGEFINFSNRSGVATFDTVTENLSNIYRIPRGVMVKVTENSGDSADIFKSGDIIVAVNGVEIHDIEGLNEQSKCCVDDESFTLTIFRKNKYIDLVIRSIIPS